MKFKEITAIGVIFIVKFQCELQINCIHIWGISILFSNYLNIFIFYFCHYFFHIEIMVKTDGF